MSLKVRPGGVAEIVGGKAVPIPGSQVPPFDKIYSGVLQDRQGNVSRFEPGWILRSSMQARVLFSQSMCHKPTERVKQNLDR
jgi:hypothetical protein